MAKRGKKAKDTGQQDTPVGERTAGPELDAAHEQAIEADLSEAVDKGYARLYELAAEITSKTERHIAPLRQERRDAWAALKTATGMDRKDLEIEYARYARVRDLENFEDEQAALIVKQNIKRLYHAAKQGETLNFLDAIEPLAPGNGEAPKSARNEGYRDFGLGMNFDQCPYKDAVNRESWQSGFLQARETFSRDAPPAPPAEAPGETTQH